LQKIDGIDSIKKEAFKLLEAFCIFGYWEFYKKNPLHLGLHASKCVWKRIIGPNAYFENVRMIG
jgi:hypothetical protein